jgi:hypothetical protein
MFTSSQKSFKLAELDSSSLSSILSSNSLFQLSIDLGDGRKETLTINENDNPELQAIEFCHNHNLGPAIKIAICDHLDTLLSTKDALTSASHKTSPNAPAFFSLKLHPTEKNIGAKLYEKGLIMRKRVETQNQKRRETFLAEESKNLTFQPRTNSPLRRGQNIEDLLIQKGKQTSEKIRRRKSEKKLELLAACPFSPEINKNKAKTSNRLKKDETFDNLYRDAVIFREKQNKKKNEM